MSILTLNITEESDKLHGVVLSLQSCRISTTLGHRPTPVMPTTTFEASAPERCLAGRVLCRIDAPMPAHAGVPLVMAHGCP